MTLDDLRQQINAVDDQLLDLLAQRAELVAQVGALKQQQGRAFHDPERERGVLARLSERGAGRFPADGVRAVFREIMSACLALEAPLRVAFLGPEGTFTHLAARYLFGLAVRYQEAPTIAGVFDAVSRGAAAYGVVPVENSTEGAVTSTSDALLESELAIRQELVLEVSHCLVSQAGGLGAIERVHSHPQALAQCQRWLQRNLPGAQLVQAPSTAAALRETRVDERAAAIASRLAAELYGARVLREGIQDQVENATRFLVLGGADTSGSGPSGDDRTTLAFSVKDGPGALRRVLGVFEDAGLNLSRIESRPSRQRPWEYAFLVDLHGHQGEAKVQAALQQLGALCERLRVLGSYPRSAGRVTPRAGQEP